MRTTITLSFGIARTSCTYNRYNHELRRQLYKQGLTDFLSVLQVQRDLFASEDALAQSDRDITTDYVALYKALGGGWEAEASAKVEPSPGKAGDRVIDVSGS